jgi:hypothetical protein
MDYPWSVAGRQGPWAFLGVAKDMPGAWWGSGPWGGVLGGQEGRAGCMHVANTPPEGC